MTELEQAKLIAEELTTKELIALLILRVSAVEKELKR